MQITEPQAPKRQARPRIAATGLRDYFGKSLSAARKRNHESRNKNPFRMKSTKIETRGSRHNKSENGDGPRLVACILLLPEHAEVLSGLLRSLTTNSNVPEDLEALKQPKGFPRPETCRSLAAPCRGCEISRHLEEYPISLCAPGEDRVPEDCRTPRIPTVQT